LHSTGQACIGAGLAGATDNRIPTITKNRRKKRSRKGFFFPEYVEREKRLELSTSTLARLRSTN
jgi:hypothetical protein